MVLVLTLFLVLFLVLVLTLFLVLILILIPPSSSLRTLSLILLQRPIKSFVEERIPRPRVHDDRDRDRDRDRNWDRDALESTRSFDFRVNGG